MSRLDFKIQVKENVFHFLTNIVVYFLGWRYQNNIEVLCKLLVLYDFCIIIIQKNVNMLDFKNQIKGKPLLLFNLKDISCSVKAQSRPTLCLCESFLLNRILYCLTT